MEDIASFGYWVRRRRKALDLTQAALAQRVGCAVVTIKKIERDERRPSRQMATLLAEHLAIPEAERDDFLRLARGKFVPAMASPLETIPPPAFLQAHDETPTREDTNFVARERELAQLDTRLDTVLAGNGTVVFAVGEAGSGKTALVQEFTRRSMDTHTNLIVAGGNCNAFTGVGDPYLPFREILGLLSGDIEARWAAGAISREHARRLWDLMPQSVGALVRAGPDLIDTLIPGSALVTRATSTAPGDADWLTQLQQLMVRKEVVANLRQQDLFEQYSKVQQALARQRPLLLVLDDLQWADAGSVNLLFHLGRRLEGSRILVVGIYRPHDVAVGRDGERHPLESVVNEFQRTFGDIHIDLSQAEGRSLVEALLDSEPHRLSATFQEALYQQTRGHALFTVEMLRGLQERGDLIQDELGRWVERPALDWETLPARVEGIIGERLGRLPARLQEALNVASVEGEFFTAEVVARVRAVDEPKMVTQLSSVLDKQHRLVRSQSSRRLGSSGQRLSFYRFRHILFQRYVYNSLDEVERVYLHEAVGNVLEQLYEGQTEEVAGQLARHFQAAGLTAKAVNYLHQAGERAVRLSANEEAIGHYTQALELLETLPDTPERTRQELSLQIALSAPLAMTKGYGAPEMIHVYTRARELAQQVGETPQLFPVLRGLWNYNLNQANLRKARELVEQLFGLANSVADPVLIMQAHWMFGETFHHLGEMVNARTHLERALALYDHETYRSHPFPAVQEPRVVCLIHLAFILFYLGYPDQGLDRINEALILAQALPDSITLAHTTAFSAALHLFRREEPIAQERAEATIALSNKLGFAVVSAAGKFLKGLALTEQGVIEEGISLMRQSLDIHQATGASVVWRPEFIVWLAEAYIKTGRADVGLSLLDEALAIVNKAEKHYCEAELYRLKGELLLKDEGREARQNASRELSPEACFRRAIDIARRQQAKSLELRAVMSLSRLWRDQGKKEEARQMLAEIYGWFSEGFDTGDLKAAKALLKGLA